MKIKTWNEQFIQENGTITNECKTILQEINDKSCFIITFVGSSMTQDTRHQLIENILQTIDSNIKVSLSSIQKDTVDFIASIEKDDRNILWMDVNLSYDSYLWPLSGPLLFISSLVILFPTPSDINDTPSDLFALPTFPPMEIQLEKLKKSLSSYIDTMDFLPHWFTIDLSVSNGMYPSIHAPIVNSMKRYMEYNELLGYEIKNQDKSQLLPISFVLEYLNMKTLFAKWTSKRLFGIEMHGEMIYEFMQRLTIEQRNIQHISSSNTQVTIDFYKVWEQYIEMKCQDIIKDACITYVDCLHALAIETNPVTDVETFQSLHHEMYTLALDIYYSSVYIYVRHPCNLHMVRKMEHELVTKLLKHYEEEENVFKRTSRIYCQALVDRLWEQVKCNSMTSLIESFATFQQVYNQESKGPSATQVLLSVYTLKLPQAMKEVEIQSQGKVSESKVKELEDRLIADFEQNKKELILRFEKQHHQLRDAMKREAEMNLKIANARVSREKLDENEISRWKNQVTALEQENEKLKLKQLTLNQETNKLQEEKDVLTSRVSELETTLVEERGNRAELVDTLGANVRNFATKERELLAQIKELQQREGEKSARLEFEFKELTLALKKTTEEKSELQNKLNELFLRIANLPESLQKHLICLDTPSNTDEIAFADSLQSYMS